MRVYTRGGDGGKTSLFSGERMSKSDARIEAYGDVDELNAALGVLVGELTGEQVGLAEEIWRIQSDLFHVGAWLATTPGSPALGMLEPITKEHAARLEQAMDRMAAALPPLRSFLLPGGDRAAAWAHVARTVCRRAERHVVRLAEESADTETGLGPVLVYLNRLSDYLFVAARYCSHLAGVSDVVWKE
jgi:cob(I)alamin adenosyltransferase